MSHWQLPWRGPVRRVDRAGRTTGWDVMADPSLGVAVVVGVVVDYQREGQPRLQAQSALPQAWRWKVARVGQWSRMPPPEPGQTVIYVMHYDQLRDMPGATFADKDKLVEFVGRHLSLPGDFGLLPDFDLKSFRLDRLPEVLPDAVEWNEKTMAELNKALADMADARGDDIEDFLFMDDTLFDSRRRFGAPPADSVTVAFGSCQYPAGMFDRKLAEHSWRRLSAHLRSTIAVHPECLLLLGDQIYADATSGLLDPLKADDRYNTPHEDLLKIPALRDVMRRIPVHMMLDDHEIQDNWEPFRYKLRGARLEQGLDAYWRYQRSEPPRDATWFELEGAHWSAFMADSRTQRDYRSASKPGQALILGDLQTKALETWLLSSGNAGKLKLVCCPAMLLPRHVEHQAEPDYLDNWDGYPGSLVRMLSFVFDNRLSDVCFLSGDAHLGCDAHITVSSGADQVRLRSIHTTSLYAPFPFANEREANLKLDDEFSFSMAGRTYNVKVTATATPDRDGWTLLRAGRDPVTGEWDIQASTM